MKRIILMAFGFSLFFIFLAKALEISTFNDSTSAKNMTFTTDENKTFYITVPKRLEVTSAELYLGGYDYSGSYPSNPYLDVSGDGDTEWSFTGEFNGTDVWQLVRTIDLSDALTASSGTSGAKGMDTNMTKWSDECCFFIIDDGDDKIKVFNTSGNNLQNISGNLNNNPKGIFTNASGVPVTDFWIVRTATSYINHTNNTAHILSDNLFEYKQGGYQPYIVWINTTSSSGVGYFLDPEDDELVSFSSSGSTITATNLPTYAATAHGISSNCTDTEVDTFVISDNTEDKLYITNSTAHSQLNISIGDDGANNPFGVALYKTTGTIQDIFVVDGDDKYIYHYQLFSKHTATEDFFSSVDTYLSTCTPDVDGDCDVPFVLHSDTAGIIQADDINITGYYPPYTFNDSTSAKNMTFTTDENKTAHVNVPKYSYVTNATLNVTYIKDTSFVDEKQLTGEQAFIINSKFYGQNFSVDEGDTIYAINIWLGGNTSVMNYPIVMYLGTTVNGTELGTVTKQAIEITGGSSSYEKVSFIWNKNTTRDTQYWFTIQMNSSLTPQESVNMLRNDSSYANYSKGVAWENTSIFSINTDWKFEITTFMNYTTNPYLDVSGDGDSDWSYTGEFNQSVSPEKTSDFSSEINDYLWTCTPDINNDCTIPLVFHSDTPGIIQADDLNITYDFYYNYKTEHTTPVFETQTTNFYLYIQNDTTINNASLVWNGTVYTSTSSVGSSNTANYTKSLTIPLVDDDVNVTFYWNFFIDGTTRNTTYENQTLVKVSLINCTQGGLTAFTFNMLTESNETVMNATLETTFNVWFTEQSNRTYYFEFIGNYTYDLCIYPNYSSYNVDAHMDYYANGYEHRTYFLDDATVSNVTQTINLYLVTDAESDGVTITVVDQSGIKTSDAFIKVQRFYLNGSSYKTVTITKTDSEGEAYTYLILYDIWYKFIIEKDGSILFESAPMQIKETEFTITIPTGVLPDWYSYYDKIMYSCTENNATGLIRCTVTDTSGLVHEVCLKVTKRTGTNETVICDSCEDYSSAITLTCTVGNMTGNVYFYQLYIKLDEWVNLVSKWLDSRQQILEIVRYEGVVASAMLIGTVSAVGFWNPVVAIIFGIVGLGFATFMGFLDLGIGALISIIVIGILIVYRMRSSS